MANGFKIAEGYVEVGADTSKVPEAIRDTEKESKTPAEKAGQGIGKTLAQGIGAAIVAGGIRESIMGAMDAGAGSSLVAAQLDLTKTESAAAGKIAGSLYAANYGESLGDVQQAVGAVVGSIEGMDLANEAAVSSMTGKLLNLQTAFGIDVGRSAQVAGQMVASGLAGDPIEAVDLLTKALQSVPAAVREDVVDAIDEYGPFMDQLGIKGADAMGLLVEASSKGMYGIDKTGDALKEFAIRSTDMSKASGEAYKTLGMDQEEMTNKILAGGDTAAEAFGEIVAGIGDITDPAAQSTAAIALFGTPIEDLGTKDLPKFLDSLHSTGDGLAGVEGAADKMGATLADNAASKVETAKRGIEMWGQSLIETKGPMGEISALAAGLGPEVLTAGAAMVTAGSAAAPLAVKVGAAAVALGVKTAATVKDTAATAALAGMYAKDMVVGLAASTGAMVKNGAVAVATGVKTAAMGAAQLAVKAPMLAAAAATGIVTAAQWLFNAAMTANPIGIIVVAIGVLIGIIVALVMNWDTVVAFITTIWSGFISWITGVIDGFAAWWNGIWTGITTFVSQAWTNFTTGVQIIARAHVAWVMGVFVGFVSWWNGIWTGIANFVKTKWNEFTQGVRTIFQNFLAGIQIIGARLNSWWSGLWSGFKGFVDGAITNVKNAWNGFTSFLGGIPGKIGDVFSSVASAISSPFRSAFNSIARGWNNTVGNLSFTFPDWVPGMGGKTISGPKIPYLATGGTLMDGGSFIAGENGPELITGMKGATVHPYADTRRMLSGETSKTETYTQDVKITINEARDPLGSAGRVARELRRKKPR